MTGNSMDISVKVNDFEIIIYKKENSNGEYVINPDATDSRICRTIKSQYYKNSLANILHHGTYGCTGVLQRI